MIEMMDQAEIDRLTADLRSGQPERVTRALETLDQAWLDRRIGLMPMPEPDCLAAFGDFVPPEVLARYISVIENYLHFEPAPRKSDRRHALVEALIRYGRGERALGEQGL